MTVTVKKHSLEDFIPFECECRVCGCLMEVTEVEDLKIGSYGAGQRDDVGEMKIYVDCPDCMADVVCPAKQQELYAKKVLVMKRKK